MRKKRIKTLTLRKIPDRVADAVQRHAESGHLSFSKALLSLLENKLLMMKPKSKRRRDLRYIAGAWAEKESKQFDAGLADQRKIDPEMWK